MLIGVGDDVCKKALPFAVGEPVVIEGFKLKAQVRDQFILRMDGQIGIALLAEHTNEFLFEFGLALILFSAFLYRDVFRYDSVLIGLCDDIEVRHLFISHGRNVACCDGCLLFRGRHQLTV